MYKELDFGEMAYIFPHIGRLGGEKKVRSNLLKWLNFPPTFFGQVFIVTMHCLPPPSIHGGVFQVSVLILSQSYTCEWALS